MDIYQTQDGERVTSSYAELFLNDEKNIQEILGTDFGLRDADADKSKISNYTVGTTRSDLISANQESKHEGETNEDWESPSDIMIGLVDFKPPYTSKIIRAKTHEGILKIGDEIIQNEYANFLKYLKTLLDDNDASWKVIIQQEILRIKKLAAEKYRKILEEKFKVMQTEVTNFFTNTLEQLEDHIKSEVEKVLSEHYAATVSKGNVEIREKLKQEKIILERVLQERYRSEVEKITNYYEILYNNEKIRCEQLIGEYIIDRNDAIKAYTNLVEAENSTNIMYVMSTERRKCTIKKILVEYIHTEELKAHVTELKNECEILQEYTDRDLPLPEVERQWQEKLQKILKLFLKFISFCLKLLPEQATFLLDLEKMFVLQVNEFQKSPENPPVLFKEDDIYNNFAFDELDVSKPECIKEPFIVEGNPNPPTPTKYGSRETLDLDVSLPVMRVQRQFVYAKCDRFDEVKAFLDSNKCKCTKDETIKYKRESEESDESVTPEPKLLEKPEIKSPSEENYVVHERDRYFSQLCPSRRCQRWMQRNAFPILENYLDYTVEKYQRVLSILGQQPKAAPCSFPLVNPQKIAFREMQFAPTKEEFRNKGTQYSSQESLVDLDRLLEKVANEQENVVCACAQEYEAEVDMTTDRDEVIKNLLKEQKLYFKRILNERPELLALLDDEGYDIPNDKVT